MENNFSFMDVMELIAGYIEYNGVLESIASYID